ncbi:MAG: hypothetical protein ACYDH5_02330 [Acidimicrobiales bacterium]
MTNRETSTKQTSSSPHPRKAHWFAAGVISLAVLGAGAGTAFASTGATPGGTVARDHSSACNLAGTTALSGNWAHGAYVRAAKAADPANVRAAAQSPCGKPTSAQGA